MSGAVGAPALGVIDFDPVRLGMFLARRVEECDGVPVVERIGGGQSNPTFFVTYPRRRLVLRKKPSGDILPSAHAVDREFRVQAALATTGVPVPRVLFFHGESDIVGTPFYVMERLDGRVFHDASLPGVEPSARRAMYFAMAETLAALHAVDWQGIGLGDFGRPGNYFERQIARWTKQWQLSRTRDLPEIDRLIAWLPAHTDRTNDASVCHGDYRLGNLMFHPAEPRVIAILDWELSTIGHPLADAAYSCMPWHSAPAHYGGILGTEWAVLGIPSEREYLERYQAARGGGAPVTRFHLVFSLFRFAVILEGIAARAKSGTASAANAAEVGDLSVAFARRAVELLDQP